MKSSQIIEFFLTLNFKVFHFLNIMTHTEGNVLHLIRNNTFHLELIRFKKKFIGQTIDS